MARYLFRLSILGPRALSAAQINAAADDTFRRFGFAVEDATITQIKSLAPPTLRMDPSSLVAEYVVAIPGQGEWLSGAGVTSPEAAAVRAIRTLTQASIVIHGTLPPDSASGRAGSAVLSSAVFAALNAAFASQGFFNLTGSGREAGLVAAGGGGGAGVALLAVLGAGVYLASQSREGRLFGLGKLPRGAIIEGKIRKDPATYRQQAWVVGDWNGRWVGGGHWVDLDEVDLEMLHEARSTRRRGFGKFARRARSSP